MPKKNASQLNDNSLDKLHALAFLNVDDNHAGDTHKNTASHSLLGQLNNLLSYMQTLNTAPVEHLAPLLNPLESMPLYQNQPFREDVKTEDDNSVLLAKSAPHFDKQLYLVPNILEQK